MTRITPRHDYITEFYLVTTSPTKTPYNSSSLNIFAHTHICSRHQVWAPHGLDPSALKSEADWLNPVSFYQHAFVAFLFFVI